MSESRIPPIGTLTDRVQLKRRSTNDEDEGGEIAMFTPIAAIVLSADLDSASLQVTLRRHDRTETVIDTGSGRARAAIAMTFFSEPT